MPFHWTCPYCDRDTTITDTCSNSFFNLTLKNGIGLRHFATSMVVCPNPKCQKFTLDIWMYEYKPGSPDRIGDLLQHWKIIPPSTAKVFPVYVPQPIRDDYVEACQIRDLSPKASATLSRRCLQGMIRDFWDIKKARLVDEIDALKDKVDADTWAGIDAVRSVGNIGAHMEKDINVIVDVEPNEAQLLIGLIEMLVKDWYITREQRKQRLQDLVKLKGEKDAAKGSGAILPKLPE